MKADPDDVFVYFSDFEMSAHFLPNVYSAHIMHEEWYEMAQNMPTAIVVK